MTTKPQRRKCRQEYSTFYSFEREKVNHSFRSLAGIHPGVTRLQEVTRRFGDALVSEASDGGHFFTFARLGVHVSVAYPQKDLADPVVDEVRLSPPSLEALPCGICLGQNKWNALETLRGLYRITDEYTDAVYFRPDTRDDLLACVEFLEKTRPLFPRERGIG